MKIFDKFKKKCSDLQINSYTGLLDIGEYLDNPESRYVCHKCNKKFGFFYFTVRACSVKMGEKFSIKCRKCGYTNVRTRGDMKGLE